LPNIKAQGSKKFAASHHLFNKAGDKTGRTLRRASYRLDDTLLPFILRSDFFANDG
jgi:hypothetical protein